MNAKQMPEGDYIYRNPEEVEMNEYDDMKNFHSTTQLEDMKKLCRNDAEFTIFLHVRQVEHSDEMCLICIQDQMIEAQKKEIFAQEKISSILEEMVELAGQISPDVQKILDRK